MVPVPAPLSNLSRVFDGADLDTPSLVARDWVKVFQPHSLPNITNSMSLHASVWLQHLFNFDTTRTRAQIYSLLPSLSQGTNYSVWLSKKVQKTALRILESVNVWAPSSFYHLYKTRHSLPRSEDTLSKGNISSRYFYLTRCRARLGHIDITPEL